MTTRPAASEARERATYALALGLLAAAAAYVALRTIEYARSGPQQPLLVVRDLHVGYYWRVLHASWLGGAAAWIGWLLAEHPRRRPALWRMLAPAALLVAIAVVVLSFVFP